MKIIEGLKKLKDHRGYQGRDHQLWSIVLLVILGKLCGEVSLAGVQRFGRLLSQKQKEKLGFVKHNTPALGTITETMKAINGAELQQILSGCMVGKQPMGTLSIDGKTLQGSKSHEHPATHCVSVFCHELTAVVGQVASQGKGLEIPDAFRLLDSIDLKGIIVMGDAMFTQTSITQTIVEKGGDYVLPVKNNQKNLKEALEMVLKDEHVQKKSIQTPPPRITDD
jgi:hypothetical protein